MNREIEFRAWDKKLGRLLEVLSIDFENNFIMLTDGEIRTSSSFNNCVLEQYTGLYDKNGNKIFEGDMITCDDVIYEVYYAESGFKAMISIDGETFGGEYDLDSLSPVEVIGNIHEEVK